MKPVEIFSHGGGTQSAAITALIVQGRLPKPDYVCIVDTGREKQTTWQYLDDVIRPALKSVGLDVYRILRKEWCNETPHGMEWLSHNREHVLLPAFTNESGHVGKLSGFCSKSWKLRVRQRYVRLALRVPTGLQRNWIGYSVDESRRAAKIIQTDEYKKGLIRLPLVLEFPMRRQQAIELVKSMGWPTPPRSACWMCPNQKDTEWRETKRDFPEDFAAACVLEKEVQKVDPNCWFHRSCQPLENVDFQTEDLFGDPACESGGCMT